MATKKRAKKTKVEGPYPATSTGSTGYSVRGRIINPGDPCTEEEAAIIAKRDAQLYGEEETIAAAQAGQEEEAGGATRTAADVPPGGGGMGSTPDTLPDDFPGRKSLEAAGIVNMAQLRGLVDSEGPDKGLKGISGLSAQARLAIVEKLKE